MAVQMTTDVATADAVKHSTEGRQRGRLLRGFWRSPKVISGFVILGIFVLVAIFGPVLDHTDPSALSAATLQAPSGTHLLGTTQTGEDVLVELIYGTRLTLLVGFVSGVIATFLSLLFGVSAGYLGGTSDELLSAFTNIFLVIPGLPLVIVLAAYVPSSGTVSVALVIAVTGWAWGARVLRAQTLSLRRRELRRGGPRQPVNGRCTSCSRKSFPTSLRTWPPYFSERSFMRS